MKKILVLLLFVAASLMAQTRPGGGGAGGSGATGITPATGGPLTVNGTGNLQNLKRISKMFVFGDSFSRGMGVNSYALSYAGLLQRDVPATIYNNSVGSTVTQQYGTQVVNTFDPDPNGTNVSLISGEENNPNCAGVNACVQHYQQSESAILAWLTIPFANRVMASNCTHTSGSWTFFGVAAVVLPTLTQQQAPGTNQEPFAGTPVLTCTVTTTTATTKIGITDIVVTGQSGSFTATIDGASITDACTGTTTFNATPCSAFANGQTQGMYRQEYTVAPATTHTVVFTATGSPIFHSVDFAVPNSPSNNVVFQYATNAAWANFTALNVALQGMISTFQADGLPVNYVDVVNGVTLNGVTYAANGTTDVSTVGTAFCSASTLTKHPNTCGHEHYREVLQAAEYTALGPTGAGGFVFSSPNLDSNTNIGDGNATFGPLVTKEIGGALASAATIVPTYGVVHVSGTTPINIMTPPPICIQEYNNCYVTLIFDNAGGTITALNQVNGFSQSFTAPAAASAITAVYGFNQRWLIIAASQPQTVFTIVTGATPVINMANGPMQVITLSINAVPTLTNLIAGQKLTLEICQNATGGFTWTPPAAMHGSPTVTATASTCTTQSYTSYNGTTLVADNQASVAP